MHKRPPLHCLYCDALIPLTHEVYKRKKAIEAALTGTRKLFCCKAHGSAHMHENFSPKEKKRYHNKIASSRKNRSPEEKAASAQKMGETFSNFSPEKRKRIATARHETTLSKGGYDKINAKRDVTSRARQGDDYYQVRHQAYKSTMLERHGIPNAWSAGSKSRVKCKETLLERYGVEHCTQNKEIRAKAKDTYIANNGGLGWASDSVREKYKETLKDKYGVENPMHVPEIAARVGESFKKFGKYTSRLTKIRNGTTPKQVAWKGHETKKRKGSYSFSKDEQYILLKLRALLGSQIEHLYRDHPDYPWEADFYDPDSGTIFEYQGYFTHGKEPFDPSSTLHRKEVKRLDAINDKWASALTIKIWTKLDPKKRKTANVNDVPYVEWFSKEEFDLWYEKELAKKLDAERYKHGCFKVGDRFVVSHSSSYLHKFKNNKPVVFYPWDDLQKVIALIKPRDTIYARKTEVIEIPIKLADKFCQKYHLQGSCRGTSLAVGLISRNANGKANLLAVMTLGAPRYNSNYDYEILRLCFAVNVVGGSQKLWKYVQAKITGSFISYCDLSKFTGSVYAALGFKLKNKPRSSAHWYNKFTGKRITDNLLRQRGFDQLLGKEIGCTYGIGESNEKLMKKHGFSKIEDRGQAVFILE